MKNIKRIPPRVNPTELHELSMKILLRALEQGEPEKGNNIDHRVAQIQYKIALRYRCNGLL
ncbi:hypothetical protein [Kingella negevensis]|uniref:hypothetical protein n=1 Tax=Kingella negevensis TaxID=1522312 RepID=UPI001179BB48|nr:hypothetical protein [Kingella negevensis]MDK4688120.1 hypothetical protein [Kingella negevensis]WII90894.1 hypothetical protein QEO93_10915 [Kingella negevensis]WII93301.1 hypothetical protein QEO94_00095 [Kingella negevensis]